MQMHNESRRCIAVTLLPARPTRMRQSKNECPCLCILREEIRLPEVLVYLRHICHTLPWARIWHRWQASFSQVRAGSPCKSQWVPPPWPASGGGQKRKEGPAGARFLPRSNKHLRPLSQVYRRCIMIPDLLLLLMNNVRRTSTRATSTVH